MPPFIFYFIFLRLWFFLLFFFVLVAVGFEGDVILVLLSHTIPFALVCFSSFSSVRAFVFLCLPFCVFPALALALSLVSGRFILLPLYFFLSCIVRSHLQSDVGLAVLLFLVQMKSYHILPPNREERDNIIAKMMFNYYPHVIVRRRGY